MSCNFCKARLIIIDYASTVTPTIYSMVVDAFSGFGTHTIPSQRVGRSESLNAQIVDHEYMSMQTWFVI